MVTDNRNNFISIRVASAETVESFIFGPVVFIIFLIRIHAYVSYTQMSGVPYLKGGLDYKLAWWQLTEAQKFSDKNSTAIRRFNY